MGDVTDRSVPRSKSTLGRMPSTNSKSSEPVSSDIKSILSEVEPLPGSSSFTTREVEEIIQSTAKMVGDSNVDWLKRLNMLKTFRSLSADPTHLGTILSYLRHLMPPMQSAVKDLRSQVGREACLTVAYLSAQLGVKADCFIEPMLTTLFTLLVANSKIICVTGTSTLCMVYEYVPSWRLIPPLQTQMSSKSKEVRRAVCSVLKILLETWPTATIQRMATVVSELMKKGLVDADADARQTAREAFPTFQKVFPVNAKTILDALEPQQQRQILSFAIQPVRVAQPPKPFFTQKPPISTPQSASASSSLTRQDSLVKKTSIPVLTSRHSPSKTDTPNGQGRSASAIDIQAVNKAKQNNFSTSTRTPLKVIGRARSNLTSTTPKFSLPNSTNTSPTHVPVTARETATLDRARSRTKATKLSQSQPGSRSNSPTSRIAYATYTSPYAQQAGEPMSLPSSIRSGRKLSASSGDSPSFIPSIGRGIRRNSSNSSSRETSPQGRILSSKGRTRSISNSPQIPLSVISANSSTAKLLQASRESESALRDALRRRELSDLDCSGNQSDSEDSMSSHSHRSYRSETFSPPSTGRHLFAEENVEELLNKCGSAKWSERKEGLIGLNNYLQRYGSIPAQYLNRIGQTFCRIFMDAHTKVLSLFLDVLHVVLIRHAKDLVDFTTILLNRVLTKLGSALLSSVHTKLMMTLDLIMREMPPDLQFSAVAHYLCDPTQTPNSRSRIAALLHLFNLSSISFPVKQNELQGLVDKLLEWSGDHRSQELRRTSQEVLRSLFDMTAPQMARVLSQLPVDKQDQAKAILENHRQDGNDIIPQRLGSEDHVDVGGWNTITSDIQSLGLTDTTTEADILRLLSQMAVMLPTERNGMIGHLHVAVKESKDDVLYQCHKELLKILFNALTSSKARASDKAVCFGCLEEMCSRLGLRDCLAEYTELFIVRVTEVQTSEYPREVTKTAESCALTLASNFPPETVARAVCPIVLNKDYPINQLAIKMLQRLSETSDIVKLRALLPDVMSVLVAAYDHPDSAVRKSAVFAIVALHLKFGNDLDPFLSSLSGSKLKLLQLYIQRAQNTNNIN